MKTAVTNEGKIIEANAQAPVAAVCKFCGSLVVLRHRRNMDGQVTYFWRHKRGSTTPCPARPSPVGRRKNQVRGAREKHGG